MKVENPYNAQKRKYSGLVEMAIFTAAGWRLCTFIALGVALVAVAGVVYIGSQSKLKPYLVIMDENYQPVGLYHQAGDLKKTDERVIKSALAQFLRNWRMVSIDVPYQRNRIHELAMFLVRGGVAEQKIKKYLDDPLTNPFLRAAAEVVSIKINNVLRVTDHTWEIAWTESITQRVSGRLESRQYRANLSFNILEATPPDIVISNPIGLLISDVNWAEAVQ